MRESIGAARIYQFVSVRILLLSKLKQETSMVQSSACLQKKWRKKVLSLPNFTVGKSGFVSTLLSSNKLSSQHCASNYWSVVCKNDKHCRCFFFKWKLKAALLVFCLWFHSSSEHWTFSFSMNPWIIMTCGQPCIYFLLLYIYLDASSYG